MNVLEQTKKIEGASTVKGRRRTTKKKTIIIPWGISEKPTLKKEKRALFYFSIFPAFFIVQTVKH